MDTLISFSTWIFIDFHGLFKSLSKKCPPKPVLPSLFFFHQKKSDFQLLFCFFTFLYQMIPTFHYCYPKNKLHPIFIWLTQPVQEIVIFICLLNPIFFSLKKIKPLCPIIAITKCNEILTRQIQKETKFRFITKHITPHPFPQKETKKTKN